MLARMFSAAAVRGFAVGCMAAFAVAVANPGVALSGTFNNVWGAFDPDVSTTLIYPNGHPTFTLNLWSDQNCGGGLCTATYSVWMYNASGALVWSAGSQSNRYYSVGGNVTKVVMTRNCGCAGHNYAQRQ
ncbi:hypothetical protein [Nocardia brasiliensis]|uniref:hypothetical protein n=1 Tax=Nocardia brasiliensis TaxID=37326 RepID=UPI0024562053|nr:hypothetical protein [Nocardia brasiliensis]